MRRDRVTAETIFLQESPETAKLAERRLKEHEEFKELQKRVDERTKEGKTAGLLDRFGDYLSQLLDIDLEDILVNGWKKFEKIEEFLEKSKKSPDKTLYLALSKHTIRSQHHPYIEISIDEETIEKIVFDITLKLALEGFVLEIRGGEIEAVETGECRASGKVTCKGVLLFEKNGEKVKFPGKIILKKREETDV